MSYVHDDQYGSLLGRCVRDRAVLFGRGSGVSEMSILGEYLQRVKADRDLAVRLLRNTREFLVAGYGPRCAEFDEWCFGCQAWRHIDRVDEFLLPYDLPDDYDEA